VTRTSFIRSSASSPVHAVTIAPVATRTFAIIGGLALDSAAAMPGAPIYHADETVQVRQRGYSGPRDWELETHEMRHDGEPRCGPKPREYQGKAIGSRSARAGMGHLQIVCPVSLLS
jgi:hypothetical protein